MSDKAKRSLIRIGDMEVEGFQMPDGSYRMSQASSAKAVGLARRNVSDFLNSKALKHLLGEGYTGSIIQIDIESDSQSRGQSRINALPIEVVNAYWHWQSYRGNRVALALCMALSAESIERRFDDAFGVERPEDIRQLRLELRRLGAREEELEAMTAEAFAQGDNYRVLLESLEERLKAKGINPWSIDEEDE